MMSKERGRANYMIELLCIYELQGKTLAKSCVINAAKEMMINAVYYYYIHPLSVYCIE